MAKFSKSINALKGHIKNKRVFRAIGLMSGTSMDGIDVAALQTDGHSFVKVEGFKTYPYSAVFRKKLRAALGKSKAPALEKELTVLHAKAVKNFLKTIKGDVDCIGFHGHTLKHEPVKKVTIQIGDGKLLEKLTGIPVIYDFRSDDVKAGGQGAPLVPIYHKALAAKMKKPVVFLNIGGVANITYIGAAGELLACDTGPGNAMIDDWTQRHINKPYDKNGWLAALGMPDKAWVEKFLRHPYFKKKMPKSLDRDAFKAFMPTHRVPPDGAATLTAMTVASIMRGIEMLPEQPQKIIVCGGGRKNKTMMAMLENAASCPVQMIEKNKLNGDAIEAQAFAYLAVREVLGLPISFKGTTGRKK
jgi:anhydro-N-acetylmuramic acid kinase